MRTLILCLMPLIVMTAQPLTAIAGIDGLYVRKSLGFTSYLRVGKCGRGKGVRVVRSTHKPSIGKHIICGAKKRGKRWYGRVRDLENGKSYSGYFSLSGTSLAITGCVLGGTICQSRILRRAR